MITNFADRIKAIEEYIVSMLEAVDYEQEMKQVVFGERARRDDLPLILVIPGDAVQGGDAIARAPVIREEWKWTIAVIAIVESNDIDKGRVDVEQLAIKAGSAFLQDRTLNGNIQDLTRTRYRPRGRVELEGETLYTSAMEIELIFCNKEEI